MPDIPDAWSRPETTPIDFIVVGAGAGGAPLAARLVERGYTVLVTEMGPERPAPPQDAAVFTVNGKPVTVENTEVPLLHGETTEDERHSLRFFVEHFPGGAASSKDPLRNEVLQAERKPP
ncbi:MAG TPA: NAD(P)-binding protein, partial [Gemmata sp.]|nr:NAD(P)-binding protein [Gemmata sp.]